MCTSQECDNVGHGRWGDWPIVFLFGASRHPALDIEKCNVVLKLLLSQPWCYGWQFLVALLLQSFCFWQTFRYKPWNKRWCRQRFSTVTSGDSSRGFAYFISSETALFNPLDLELDIYSSAHHLCKMWIFYEPRRVTLGDTRHFVEE